jgi:hypothetical protein
MLRSHAWETILVLPKVLLHGSPNFTTLYSLVVQALRVESLLNPLLLVYEYKCCLSRKRSNNSILKDELKLFC